MLCDGTRAPLMLIIPVLHWTGDLSFGVLLVVAFALGAPTAPGYSRGAEGDRPGVVR